MKTKSQKVFVKIGRRFHQRAVFLRDGKKFVTIFHKTYELGEFIPKSFFHPGHYRVKNDD